MQVTGSFPIGPASENTLVYKSPQFISLPIRNASLQQARQMISHIHKSAYQMEWRAIVKNLASGIYNPLCLTSISAVDPSHAKGLRGLKNMYHPLLLNEADGQWWGSMSISSWMSEETQLEWSLRDKLTMKYSSSYTSVLAYDGGQMLWQNASSMELYGCHGQYTNSGAEDDGSVVNFLDLMFGPDDGSESLQAQMRSVTEKGQIYRVTVDIGSNPTLRSLMKLTEGQEMHLDCQVTRTQDPQTLKKIFVVSQIDVTEAVVSQRKLELAHQKLESSLLALSEEKAKVEAMMRQQADLIECLGWVSEVGRTAGTKARAAQLIDTVKRQLTGAGSSQDDGVLIDSLYDPTLDSKKIGEGSYGRVVKGKWRDLDVAVKVMMLPAELMENSRRQAMALMELAISSSLLHTNIVKTHSYSIKPIRDPARHRAIYGLELPSLFSNQSSPSSFQIQIIMEYCDLGDLRGALHTLHSGQAPNYKAILDIALDVANGMLHLHRNNIIHADLKPANVLLKSSPETPKGFIAKISDFGLSLSKDDALASNVSGFQHGTKSHMAPEILSGNGSQSNASDIYSFGILFFEIVTGNQAYGNMFCLNFDKMVVENNHRPLFPPSTPAKYKDLAAICWDRDPKARPTFEAVITILTELRAEVEGETDLVELKDLKQPSPASGGSHAASCAASAEHSFKINSQSFTDRDPQVSTQQFHDREFWEDFFNHGHR